MNIKWAIVEGATGSICIVPERMAAEHLTFGRSLCVLVECTGLIDAMDILRAYEKENVKEITG